jgi:phosphonoacetaldehyde hydrolase
VKLLNLNIPPDSIRANKLQALVFDWAGTTVDFGCMAPARTLQQVFARVGTHLTDAEVRRDMGLPKKVHIEHILRNPRVSEAWRSRHGKVPSASDADEIYQLFLPLQLSCLGEYSKLIPGVAHCVQRFRERGLKIGSTTGYTRTMLDVLLESAAKEGYQPDCSVAPEDVGAGRPYPFMFYENAIKLQIYPMAAIAKIGDTPADVEEGLNAGAWSIGVAATGNTIGMSHQEFQALPEGEKLTRLENARRELEHAGAHYVVDTLAGLDSVLDDIDGRLECLKKKM